MLFINTPIQIQHHRGDTLEFPFTILDGNSLDYIKYNLTEDDVLYFALLEPNQPWEHAIVKKKLSDSSITLEPKDTMCLLPGLYYYQIKLVDKDNKVSTLCNRSQLYILE